MAAGRGASGQWGEVTFSPGEVMAVWVSWTGDYFTILLHGLTLEVLGVRFRTTAIKRILVIRPVT